MDLLSSFTASTQSALQGLPDSRSAAPPQDGITLLDAKNEIFLSYLQTLALRNLNVLRSIKTDVGVVGSRDLDEHLTRKLVEHRVYLERGVRPLEQRIKYQADKVVKAADDESTLKPGSRSNAKTAIHRARARSEDSKGDEEDDGSEDTTDEDGAGIDELAYRPNPAAFVQPKAVADNAGRRAKSSEDGVYRPPRISATAMPNPDQRERRDRRPNRSATVDEYINTEMSIAPVAEPSIGSTITAGGRRSKNARDLAKEAERREYEETNLVRLPKESKKDMKGRGRHGTGFGGEEWRGLGENLDRIGDLTKKSGKDSALDKSRKRRGIEDGPRGDGIGSAIDVKRRRMEKKSHR